MCVCVCVQTRGDVAAAGDGTEAGAQPHGDDGGRHGLYQFVDELCFLLAISTVTVICLVAISTSEQTFLMLSYRFLLPFSLQLYSRISIV